MLAEDAMSTAGEQPRRLRQVGVVSVLLGGAAVAFVLVAISCAVFLLYQARKTSSTKGFDTFAIGALVALVGTGLTGLTAIYSATLQSNTTARIGEYSAEVSKQSVAIIRYHRPASCRPEGGSRQVASCIQKGYRRGTNKTQNFT